MAITEAYIYRSRLAHNIRLLQKKSSVPLCIALKADAYGHGAVEVARTAMEEGVGTFGFARLSEAVALEDAGLHPRCIMFSALADDEIGEAVRRGYELFVTDGEYLELIQKEAAALYGSGSGAAKVHLKVDTGMHRIGVEPDAVPALARKAADDERLSLQGVCTHFPVADDPAKEYTASQIEVFSGTLDAIRRMGIDPGLVHAANSAGLLYHPSSRFSMTRPGISVYGYPPDDTDVSLGLSPVMEFRSTVVQVKAVKAGEGVSYGLTESPVRDTRIAVIAAGYADGYSRVFSSRGRIAINGKAYKVLGRVCMDQCIVDVGPDSRVKRGDSAILFGPEPPAPSAADLASLAGTISYEITCNVSARVPRVYLT